MLVASVGRLPGDDVGVAHRIEVDDHDPDRIVRGSRLQILHRLTGVAGRRDAALAAESPAWIRSPEPGTSGCARPRRSRPRRRGRHGGGNRGSRGTSGRKVPVELSPLCGAT